MGKKGQSFVCKGRHLRVVHGHGSHENLSKKRGIVSLMPAFRGESKRNHRGKSRELGRYQVKKKGKFKIKGTLNPVVHMVRRHDEL